MCRFGLLFWLFVALLFPMTAFAQDSASVDVEEYIEALNDSCPMSFGKGWGVNSFTLVGGDYALVDLQLPSSISMVLTVLTEDADNSDNVRRMWIKQFKTFGERWTGFVDRMVEQERRIVVNLRPKGSDETELITFLPTDFKQ